MGVLNVTPDSFSDGGDFSDHDKAVGRALQMIKDGAHIIDVGGESSRPGSEPVSMDEELFRTIFVIKDIRKKSDITISIDTTKASVARDAIASGADMINDISAGMFDPEMFAVAAKADVPICLMHMRGNPKTMQEGSIHYDDVVGEICQYLEERIASAIKAGIRRENIIIDPGIGFGKTVEHNVTILKELSRLKPFSCPILVGTSRKTFVGHLLGGIGPKERLEGTLATIGIALKNGASILRVHDALAARRFLAVLTALS